MSLFYVLFPSAACKCRRIYRSTSCLLRQYYPMYNNETANEAFLKYVYHIKFWVHIQLNFWDIPIFKIQYQINLPFFICRPKKCWNSVRTLTLKFLKNNIFYQALKKISLSLFNCLSLFAVVGDNLPQSCKITQPMFYIMLKYQISIYSIIYLLFEFLVIN